MIPERVKRVWQCGQVQRTGADADRRRFDRLAPSRPQQALQILAPPMAAFAPSQILGKLRHKALQLRSDYRDLPGCHHADRLPVRSNHSGIT